VSLLPELAYLSLFVVLKVDTEKYQELAQKYKITALPTVVSCHSSCRSDRLWRLFRLPFPTIALSACFSLTLRSRSWLSRTAT
jgi:hypothetical protein